MAVIWTMSAPSALVSVVLAGRGLALLAQVPHHQLLLYVVVQGLGSGIVSAVSYNLAIRELGATLSARIAALGPVLVLVLSTLLLHQPLGPVAVVGLTIVVAGVAVQPRLADGQD